MTAAGRLVVLTGPSGVGKGSVMSVVRRDHPEVWFSVSATTRAPRPGEVDGRDYFFVTDAEFDRMVADDELLEWAAPPWGHRYGTPKRPVLDRLSAGQSALLEIELDGARQVRASMPDSFHVFLAPPSIDELRRRLVGRGTEDPEAVAARLHQATVELAASDECDAVVVNHAVPRAAQELVSLIAGLRPADRS